MREIQQRGVQRGASVARGRIIRVVTEVRDVGPGLWVWSTPHPGWTPDSDFDGPVTSTCVAVNGEVVVLDPLAPDPDCDEAWARFDAAPPTVAVVLKPDHVGGVSEVL